MSIYVRLFISQWSENRVHYKLDLHILCGFIRVLSFIVLICLVLVWSFFWGGLYLSFYLYLYLFIHFCGESAQGPMK